jgi:hypothetical protein
MFKHQIFRLNVREQLPDTVHDSRKYIENLTNLLGDQRREPLFNHLYENLSILDAKSASLLQFNSILVAVFAIFLTADIAAAPFYVGVVGILATLTSSYLLLEVVWVHWSTSDQMAAPATHELKLLEVRKSRTILYRIAWNFSKGAVLALVAVVVLIVLARFI